MALSQQAGEKRSKDAGGERIQKKVRRKVTGKSKR